MTAIADTATGEIYVTCTHLSEGVCEDCIRRQLLTRLAGMDGRMGNLRADLEAIQRAVFNTKLPETTLRVEINWRVRDALGILESVAWENSRG